MRRVIFVVGSTSVGKTALALKLAKKFNGAILSADSVQVYKGLSIVSGKDIPKGSDYIKPDNLRIKQESIALSHYIVAGVPLYSVDLVKPTIPFSIAKFFSTAKIELNILFEQNKLPFVVGGSGLYIKTILNPPETLDIKPNYLLRNALQESSISELQNKIKNLDENLYLGLNNSEKNNKRRLIRKIEILMSKEQIEKKNMEIDPLIIGLKLDKKRLDKIIERRVIHRVKKGALGEAKRLFRKYDELAPQIKESIGYREIFDFLRGKVTFYEALENWKKREINYAKKQNTWFRKDSRIKWFSSERKDLMDAVSREIEAFIRLDGDGVLSYNKESLRKKGRRLKS